MTKNPTEVNELDRPLAFWIILIIPIWAIVFVLLLVFPAAGDWRWRQGWIFVSAFAINMTISYLIINQKNPRVIRNRVKFKKTGITKETRQAAASDRFIYPLMSIGILGAVILPCLGHRFDWYALPLGIALPSVLVVNAGLVLVNMATLQNSYASKVLDINQDQVLVDTGLYARVRHPLYAGGILTLLSIPIALGSLWGLIPALFGALMLVIRIEFEEEMLLKGMEGYADYRSRVKYKLVPKVY